jgi:hypothetical protein
LSTLPEIYFCSRCKHNVIDAAPTSLESSCCPECRQWIPVDAQASQLLEVSAGQLIPILVALEMFVLNLEKGIGPAEYLADGFGYTRSGLLDSIHELQHYLIGLRPMTVSKS